MRTREGKWIIVLIAYDDPEIEACVLKERIPMDEDENLAAFMRGGELMAVTTDDEEQVIEGLRREIEKECLR
jgi:hypothetical protein